MHFKAARTLHSERREPDGSGKVLVRWRSLPEPIAANLHVTRGLADQGIAVSGLIAVLISLFISAIASSLNRKTLLLMLTCHGREGAVIALTFSYSAYMLVQARSRLMKFDVR